MSTSQPVSLKLRKSEDRGHADHDWLKTYHTFSFASYHNPKFEEFGPLRVINEDRVEPGEGFGTHGHREFEIWSYIIAGELEHRDSLGGLEKMRRGDVQMTSTGRGVRHSEFNRHPNEQVHFLQMWAKPNQSGLQPSYYHRKFTDDEKRDRWVNIVAPVTAPGVEDKREGTGPAPIHADLAFFATITSPKATVSKPLQSNTNKAYVHLIMSEYRIPGQPAPADKAKIQLQVGTESLELSEGDGAFIEIPSRSAEVLSVTNVGSADGELVLFEMS